MICAELKGMTGNHRPSSWNKKLLVINQFAGEALKERFSRREGIMRRKVL
jgi:hypothetical protein